MIVEYSSDFRYPSVTRMTSSAVSPTESRVFVHKISKETLASFIRGEYRSVATGILRWHSPSSLAWLHLRRLEHAFARLIARPKNYESSLAPEKTKTHHERGRYLVRSLDLLWPVGVFEREVD